MIELALSDQFAVIMPHQSMETANRHVFFYQRTSRGGKRGP